MIDIYARVGVQAQPEEHLVSIGAHAGFAKAAVFQGTSAYQVLTDGVRINGGPEAALPKPATEIPGCHALYKCSAHPALDPAAALLDADRLVSAHSLVPGLTRLDSTGKATLAIAQGQRTMLDLPAPVPSQSVRLPGVLFLLDEAAGKCVPLVHLSRATHCTPATATQAQKLECRGTLLAW